MSKAKALGRREVFNDLKSAFTTMAFGDGRHFVSQPEIEALGRVVTKDLFHEQRNYFQILCRIQGYGKTWVRCDYDLGLLIEIGFELPITFKVSSEDSTDLRGEIDFSKLNLSTID